MNKPKKSYEEVFSSDFSEEESETYSSHSENDLSCSTEDIDKVESINRDFWVKKTITTTSKKSKGRKKQTDEKLSNAKKSSFVDEKEITIGFEDIVKLLYKAGLTKTRKKGDSAEYATKLKKLFDKVENVGQKILLSQFIFQYLKAEFVFNLKDDQWIKNWNTGYETLNEVFNIFKNNHSNVTNEYKKILTEFFRKNDQNDDQTEQEISIGGISVEKLKFILNKIDKNILQNDLFHFISLLNNELTGLLKRQTILEKEETRQICLQRNYTILQKSRLFFSVVQNMPSITNILTMIIAQIHNDYNENNDALKNISRKNNNSDENGIESMILTVLENSTNTLQKLCVSLQYSAYLSIHNQTDNARNILILTTPQISSYSTNNYLLCLYNRAQVQLGLSLFRRGFFNESASILRLVWPKGKNLIGQGKTYTKYSTPRTWHITSESIDSALLFSSVYEVSEKYNTENYELYKSKELIGILSGWCLFTPAFLNYRTEPMRAIAVSCFVSLIKCDWRRCDELLLSLTKKYKDKMKMLFNLDENGVEVLVNKMRLKAKINGMKVYLTKYKKNLKPIPLRILSDRFDLPLDVIRKTFEINGEEEVYRTSSKEMNNKTDLKKVLSC